MSFSHDRRGQSVVVGTVILFGFLILALASYQAFAVPAQNNAAEFEHSQDVQSDMQDLRASLLDVRDASQNPYQRPVRVGIGFRYDSRLFAVNPAPPEGALTTRDLGDINITNAEVASNRFGSTADPLLDQNHSTRLLTLRPGYNEYQNPPRTTFEHSLLYNRFDGANQAVTGQRTIDGEKQELLLVVYSDDIDRQGLSTTIDPETVDGPTPTVPITNESGGSFEIELPTHSPAIWEGLVENEDNADVTNTTDSSVIIKLEGEWDLQMVRVGYEGRSVEETPFSNVTVLEDQDGREGTDLNRTYNVSWDDLGQLPTEDSTEVTGTVKSNDEPGELLDNATVDFATSSSIATFQGDNTTAKTVNGVFTTNVSTGSEEGTATLFAASGDDVDQIQVEIAEKGDFTVDIDEGASDLEVEEGEDFNVVVDIENTDDTELTQDVVAEVDGDQRAIAEDETLSGGEQRQITLSFEAQAADDGEGVVVSSDDDTDTATLSIRETTITADSIGDLIENEDGQEQTFEFTLTEGLANGQEVEIDVSEPNSEGVDYATAAIDASGNNNAEIRDGGDTLVFEAQGNTDGAQSITVSDLDVGDGSAGLFEDIRFTRLDNNDFSEESFEVVAN